jgi:hypothetical protein
MVKKNILFFVLFTLRVLLYAEEQNPEIDIGKYQNIIFTVIANLDSIMDNSQNNEMVYNTFSVSRDAVRNNEVTLKIDPRLDTVLSGMNFSIYESGEISLVFGLKYLDTYYPGSSVHYSILIHEYRHLHDYLANRTAFTSAKTNEKESYWYELDALRIESEFIKHYLAGRYELTKYEEYLLYSLENNYLNTASIFILKESMNIFFHFNNLETRYKENNITIEEIINDLEKNGGALVSEYNNNEDDFINFIHYIEISTFRKYLTRILAIIINNPVMTWGEVFERYAVIGDIYKNVSDIINSNQDRQTRYITFLYKYWEDDITGKR